MAPPEEPTEEGTGDASDEPAAPSGRGRVAGWLLLAFGLLVVVGALVIAFGLGSEESSTGGPATSTTAAPPGPEGVPTPRVSVGPGAVESSIRQVVRTLDGRVYIAAPDDDGATRNDFTTPTVLTMYRATTTGIPTKFQPADPAHSPRVEAPGTMSGGDARLDRAGVIHVVYYRTDLRATMYQTFSTVTDTWGPASVVSRFGELLDNPGYGARASALNAIALARDGTPFVVVGGAAGVRGYRKVGDAWFEDGRLSGTSSLHPAMTFDRQNRLHLAWLEGEHEIRYALRDATGRWSASEVVAAGDPDVLSNGGGDQSPSITVDAADQPMVLYLSGHVGDPDERVRLKTKTVTGWVADDPNVFAHAPGSYARGDGKWALLGHDDQIHPAYLAHVGGSAAWTPIIVFPPVGGDYQYDGSMSARYDPQLEVDCTVIDVVFFDEDSDARGGFRPDLYYAAIRLAGPTSGNAACREITPP
ncbi:MAG: hypothetical protein ACXWA9_07350 [Acidimicrobiia bacterium]